MEIDEYETIELEPKEKPVKPQPPERTVRQITKEWNKKPSVRRLGLIAIKKSSFWILISLIIIFLIIIFIGIVGGLIAFNNKSFSTNVSINNNMPDIPVNITNDYNNNFDNSFDNRHTINVNLDDDIADKIAEQVLEIIENETA